MCFTSFSYPVLCVCCSCPLSVLLLVRCVFSSVSLLPPFFFSASFSGFSFMPAWCPAFGSSFKVQKYNRTHRLTRPQPILMLNSRNYGRSMPCSLSCLDTGINREGRRKMKRSLSRTEKYSGRRGRGDTQT